MPILKYITLYLTVGFIILIVLDLMHRSTKSFTTPEDYQKNAYNNIERLYVTVAWPLILLGLLTALFNPRQDDDAEN